MYSGSGNDILRVPDSGKSSGFMMKWDHTSCPLILQAALPVEEELSPRVVRLDQKENILKYAGDKGASPGLYISAVPFSAGRSYFEIEIVNGGNSALPVGGPIVGLCSQRYPLDLLPGMTISLFFCTISTFPVVL